MTRRIGGLMDYSRLMPAQPAAADAAESDLAARAREMHAAGHGLHDIASVLRIHPEQVRRWLLIVEHDEAAAAHARAWSGER